MYEVRRCPCGKLLKKMQGEHCTLCNGFRWEILKTARGTILSDENIDKEVIERTNRFRKKIFSMSNEKINQKRKS